MSCDTPGSPEFPTQFEEYINNSDVQKVIHDHSAYVLTKRRIASATLRRELHRDVVQQIVRHLLETRGTPSRAQLKKLIQQIADAYRYQLGKKLEVPLDPPPDDSGSDDADDTGYTVARCDDISIGGKGRHPDWKKLNDYENALIERIDAQRAAAKSVQETESQYEIAVRLIGESNASFMLDYEQSRGQRHTGYERLKYYRLKKRLGGPLTPPQVQWTQASLRVWDERQG